MHLEGKACVNVLNKKNFNNVGNSNVLISLFWWYDIFINHGCHNFLIYGYSMVILYAFIAVLAPESQFAQKYSRTARLLIIVNISGNIILCIHN